ncbi:MAG TPA: SDR family NAD(P)-dependent oxidoreductase, partial [Parafilimonas sp.]|nr:SDR family NAD(P)-dependent oxidoreductase [Parafilimonas sp.]
MNWTDKIALITGGAKGIGAATAKLFYDEGATVVTLDIEHKPDVKDERMLCLKCDVSDEAQVREAFQNIAKRFS